ncbi:MAG: helix-turn-helix domain-containing protein [Myxococcota bacterium]
MAFGAFIRREREKRGLSLRALSEQCGVDAGYLSRIENEHVSPSQHLLGELSTVLGCDPAVLWVAAGQIPKDLYARLAEDPHEFASRLRELASIPYTPFTKRCIEGDIPVEALSDIAELESWRKEIHRPIYHMHKWWAQRLGSVFRAIILASTLPEGADLMREFYGRHDLGNLTIFDPFLGSGTTLGEGIKLGAKVIGRDINPVATRSVMTALGPIDREAVEREYERLDAGVGRQIRALYRGRDRDGKTCDVLYHFWVATLACPECDAAVDLFPSYIFARHAYASKHPECSILCPACGEVFRGDVRAKVATCPSCESSFAPHVGPAKRTTAVCGCCDHEFKIAQTARAQGRLGHRQYAKLVLTKSGQKQYLRVTDRDLKDYRAVQRKLAKLAPPLPNVALAHGHNTKQAMNYGFASWRDFFNDRQLLGLSLLGAAIANIEDAALRRVFSTLFSGALEFNNMFASFKGEGTGAVRHMFSHHILKPERMPLEANIWGTSKSSGSFSGLYKTRVLRALDYKDDPVEIRVGSTKAGKAKAEKVRGVNHPATADLITEWPADGMQPGQAYISCGDSAQTDLPDRSVDLVVTDPPFFDNVHYSELADFFHAWQATLFAEQARATTRASQEVQDADADRFSEKLGGVFAECHRVLVDDGLLVFSYHHSRDDGWRSLAHALCIADFAVVASHPVKAEMSVATPKSAAKEPIDVDSILVCRKRHADQRVRMGLQQALGQTQRHAAALVRRFSARGRPLSRGDLRVMVTGELLALLSAGREEVEILAELDASKGAVDRMIDDFSSTRLALVWPCPPRTRQRSTR